MSPAPLVLNPAMVNMFVAPPLDRKPWLHPISAPVPSRSQAHLSWLQLPPTPTASSLMSPLEPPSSAMLPPPSNSNTTSTPPAPSSLFATGPSTYPPSMMTLHFPVVRGDHVSYHYSRSCYPPPPPASHRYHPYTTLPAAKRVNGPPASPYSLPPNYTQPHSAATTTFAFAHGPHGELMTLPPLPQQLPPPTFVHGRGVAGPVLISVPVAMLAQPSVPNRSSSSALPPAAVLPRHPELVAHAAFTAALESKRRRIMQWALEVSSAGAGAPQVDGDLLGPGSGSTRSLRGTRSARVDDDLVFQPSAEDDAAIDAAARARRLDD